MKKYICTFLFFLGITNVFSQSDGNILLHFKSKFGRYWGVGDVWGVQINATNYALVTLDEGLSIVNTENPSNPIEVRHINHTGYDKTDPETDRLGVEDVETFIYNGITYAYLATDHVEQQGEPPYPLVIIINVNEAVSQQGLILFDQVNDTPDPNEVYAGKVDNLPNVTRSHTLTIEDSYLFVASFNQYIPIYDLDNYITGPANPVLVTNFLINSDPLTELQASMIPISMLPAFHPEFISQNLLRETPDQVRDKFL